MESHFDPAAWEPTKPPDSGEVVYDTGALNTLFCTLRQQTSSIKLSPYDPETWLQRAETLVELRYPELAMGDAYKARLLCDAHKARLPHTNGWSLGFQMGFWVRDESANSDGLDNALLQHRLSSLREAASRIELDLTEEYENDRRASFRRRPYPWMHRAHQSRSNALIRMINDALIDSCLGDDREPSCMLLRDAFHRDGECSDTSDVLGVFPARDISEGEIILVDHTRIWGCNGPGTSMGEHAAASSIPRELISEGSDSGEDGDYSNLFGGKGCYDPVHPNSEDDDTRLDLRWVRDRAGRHAAVALRNVKLLLCCIQDGARHPLDHSLIARITPNYARDTIEKISLVRDIEITNRALQLFGIDIFANHNFDSWVLFTLDARAANNSCGNPSVDLLCPLFALFNHSCEPNCDWTIAKDHQSVIVTAQTPIKMGEQMLVSYDQYLNDATLDERRTSMWKWLDGPCQCTKCMREEEMRQKSSRGLSSSASSEDKDSKLTWDNPDERPILPEDLATMPRKT